MAVSKPQWGGLDRFKILAALLVIAIHTSPLYSINLTADFIFTRILCRIAVPFFLMVTGQFLLPQYVYNQSSNFTPLWGYCKKIGVYYFFATLLYLPVQFYTGRLATLTLSGAVKAVLWDGTFYHLWYFPACITGVVLVVALSRKLPPLVVSGIAILLYGIGLLGDNYYGLIGNLPVFSSFYKLLFQIFGFTRNGFFYAPVFLLLGAWFGKKQRVYSTKRAIVGFVISMVFMVGEGMLLNSLGFAKHDSMYIALLPAMFFLYQILISWDIAPKKSLRNIATWVYVIHPLCIILVRGIAKVTGMADLLVDSSLTHFIAVAGLSFAGAILIDLLTRCKKEECKTGRAWIEISRSNLACNIKELQSVLSAGCQLMPAVKANAYGHGSVLMAKELSRLGVHSFCVASVKEGMELRKKGIYGEILVLGYTHPRDFNLLWRYRLMQTVIDYNYALVMNGFTFPLQVHIKLDTGMHRLGILCPNTREIYSIFSLKHLKVKGVFTHLSATSGHLPADKAYTLVQSKEFWDTIALLKDKGIPYGKAHLLSSGGLINYPELGGNYARVGIGVYGLFSNRNDLNQSNINLMPIASVKARVAMVKDVYKGDAVGYDLKFVAETNRRIATLTIGYGDGIPRELSCGVGQVIIHGKMAPIIGRICMDQMMVDVTHIESVKSGDVATIIGGTAKAIITTYDLAEASSTITNEIVSGFAERMPRIIV